MLYQIKRTDEEINDVLNRCSEAVEDGVSEFPRETYEAGVQAAIEWLTGGTGGENPLG